MVFGVLEVGSTNTKAFIYKDGELHDYGIKYIPFKDNYKKDGRVSEIDLDKLKNLILDLKLEVDEIYAYGTSIFRNINNDERTNIIKMFQDEMNVSFRVVSADEENKYTVEGVIANIDYKGRMAVIIGGGGSSEVAIIDEGRVVDTLNLSFGAMDITNEFPELKEDVVTTSFDKIFAYTNGLIPKFQDNVEVTVLAGGDYIYFYEKVGFPMNENIIYSDVNQPYMLDIETSEKYDYATLNISLDKIKAENPELAGWWDGARGMRFCINVLAKRLNTKYIVPTRINMLLGLMTEIVKKKH